MSHTEHSQCIQCSVVSCRHLKKEKGMCGLDSVQIEPTPMAYTGEAADESMCGSYSAR